MSSRAVYRLLLSKDNAHIHLRKIGYKAGLISEEQINILNVKEKEIEKEIQRLKATKIGANKEVQDFLVKHNSSTLKTAASLAELICRPELSYEILEEIDSNRKSLEKDILEQVNINIKYEGYIERQLRQVEQFKKMEDKKIPHDLNYEKVNSLRIEAKQKLIEYKPVSIGQASRILGVSPADISVLMVYLESYKKKKE